MMNNTIERYRREEGASAYEGKYERTWTRKMDNIMEHRILSRLFSEVGDGLSLLNVACGAGRFCEIILLKAERAVFGDLSLPMVRLSRERLTGSGGHLSFISADAMKLPFADCSFDLVMAVRLLHHLHDHDLCEVCVGEILRVSRRWAIVTFADALSFKGRHRRFKQRWLGRKRGEAMMDRRDLTAIVNSHSYRPVRFLPVSTWFSTQTYALLERYYG